ncbi:MAG: substrate-binding domain-containing protein [Thermodesulfobacteriota bacterium]|nr:substrate-binding domain-containing protein [Thermodesulfobacteriota bacterium]
MKAEKGLWGGSFILMVFLLSNVLFLGGCGGDNDAGAKKKELLVYCGITMIRPMSDIARIIENREDCRIIITKGGSGNLFKSIKTNNVGDLYLPGSDSYIQTCLKEGLVFETAFVGYNKAAMMVQKGNPKGISADLNNFADKRYYVVVGNPNSGSIGKETKNILVKKGIFEKVINNARHLTTDSKNLALVIKNKEADLVINWYATAKWPENEPFIDVLPIDEKFCKKKKLVIGLLNTSKYPEIARKFMKYASSEEGHSLFKKHGFYEVE